MSFPVVVRPYGALPKEVELVEMNPDGTYAPGVVITELMPPTKKFNVIVMPNCNVQIGIAEEDCAIPKTIRKAYEVFAMMQENEMFEGSPTRNLYKERINAYFSELNAFNSLENEEGVNEFHDGLGIRLAVIAFGKDDQECAKNLSIYLSKALHKIVIITAEDIKKDFPIVKGLADKYREAFYELNNIIKDPTLSTLEFVPALRKLVRAHTDFINAYESMYDNLHQTKA